MKRLAIFGDSFAAPDPSAVSWPRLLGQHYSVTNHAQAGSSQYRIWQQIQRVDLDAYDLVLCVHTSSQRVFVPHNPLHALSAQHQHCDVIFSDIEGRGDEFSRACQGYFRHIHDITYHNDLHNLICERIHRSLTVPTLHTTHFDYQELYEFPGLLNFHNLFRQHRGHINHYNEQGNRLVYQHLLQHLDTLC